MQSCGARDDHVIEAFASNKSDEPLDVGVLPGRAWSGYDLLDLHGCEGAGDSGECAVAIVPQVGRAPEGSGADSDEAAQSLCSSAAMRDVIGIGAVSRRPMRQRGRTDGAVR